MLSGLALTQTNLALQTGEITNLALVVFQDQDRLDLTRSEAIKP